MKYPCDACRNTGIGRETIALTALHLRILSICTILQHQVPVNPVPIRLDLNRNKTWKGEKCLKRERSNVLWRLQLAYCWNSLSFEIEKCHYSWQVWELKITCSTEYYGWRLDPSLCTTCYGINIMKTTASQFVDIRSTYNILDPSTIFAKIHCIVVRSRPFLFCTS